MNLSVISRVSLSVIVSQDLPYSECCPCCSLQGTSVRLQCWRQNVVCALAAARLALILERMELVNLLLSILLLTEAAISEADSFAMISKTKKTVSRGVMDVRIVRLCPALMGRE